MESAVDLSLSLVRKEAERLGIIPLEDNAEQEKPLKVGNTRSEKLRIKEQQRRKTTEQTRTSTKEFLPTSFDILTGKKSFSDPEWENELNGFISYLLVNPGAKQHLLHPTEDIHAIVKSLLAKLKASATAEYVHKALLGLLTLAITHPEATIVEGLQAVIHENVLDKYPLDDFLQAAGNKLLNIEEGLEGLEVSGTPFEYPPFQKALPYFPSYGYQVTIVFVDGKLNSRIQNAIVALVNKLKKLCEEIDSRKIGICDGTIARSGFNIGFDLDYWKDWCKLLDRKPSIPVKDAARMMSSDEENFMKKHSKLRYTRGHVWFYLKADKEDDCESMLKLVRAQVDDCGLPAEKLLVTKAYKKNDGRVFGGQFLDGISNAVDTVSMIREVLIPPMVSTERRLNPEGGAFAFVQFFELDKSALREFSQPISENMIGRDSVYSETLARLDDRCHIKKARVINPKDGTNTELLRQTLPFFRGTSSDKDRGPMSDGLFFVAFGQSAERFRDILQNILGDSEGFFTQDLLLNHVQGRFGKLFYCPNTNELDALPQFTDRDLYPHIPFWTKYVSENHSYFYNHIQYLHTMATNYVHKDPPSKRILYLMSSVFARWHSTWIHKFDVPRLPHLKDFLRDDEKEIMDLPIQVRKGYSYKKMLGEVFTSNKPLPDDKGKVYGYSENFDTYRVAPKELIVGVTDRLSFGSGKEVMPYLKEGSETTLSWNLALTESGNMGHIVPGHNYLLELGVLGMLTKLREKSKQQGLTEDQKMFYQSAIYSFEGVQLYLLKYGRLALKTARTMHKKTTEANDRKNLRSIANRMERLAYGDPQDFSFHDAVQLVFSMHCCLHLVGQAVSVGRLDQLLIGFYNKDIQNGTLTLVEAQEIIDAFFIKFDEHVVMNRYNIPYGHTTYGSTCVTGRGGPFPTGDSLNQWIQQITVGGYMENGVDGCNDITLMCLKACRRLPLNAPCVSLRLNKFTPTIVKEEAVKALLSGGAHPILFHDDKMVDGLYEVLRESFVRSGIPEPKDLKQVARDYSCDGCYEPMFTGRTEFKFAYIFLLKAVIFAINSGADYRPAGPLYLAGGVSSYRTPLPKDIKDFESFQGIFLKHLKLLVEGLYSLILNAYGNPWQICPSPLLSCLLEGCVDNGMDMTNGGSRFHILTPMFVGFANTVNSLYNVKKMVYDGDDVTTLETLRMALINNWGEATVEPFYDSTGEGVLHSTMSAQKFKDLRDYALQLPKFGTETADDEINQMAAWLATEMNKLAYEALYDKGPILDKYNELREKFSVPGKPFLFQVMTGSGTFESYFSVGAACAATPDGRLSGQPTASDASAQPFAQDRPVPNVQPLDIIDNLKPYNTLNLDRHLPNGCEVDLNIPEDFPFQSLMEFVEAFIKKETGSNLVTVTCADPATLQRAQDEPQKFDLVRNRMGGWSNFFVSMFPGHQLQHVRRPMYGPHKK